MTPPTPDNLSRRGVVAAAACAVCGLAACSNDATQGDPIPSSQVPTNTGGAPQTDVSSAAPSKSLQTAESGPVGSTIPKSAVPVGGGVIVTEGEIVVTQPTAGDFKAFSSICTHKECPVTSVQDGFIECNCHGSRFSIADGSVDRGPATDPLPSKSISVEGDTISLG